MAQDLSGTITDLLGRMHDGDDRASDELLQIVQAELREIARGLVGRAARSSIESTELVNAACERLLGKSRLEARNRRHFFFLFGRAMKDVLVEQERSRASAKRGGSHRRIPLLEIVVDGGATNSEILDIRAAVEALREADPQAARVVDLRFFAGRTIAETAELLDCSVASVRREWEYARAWLSEHLSDRA